MRIVNRIAVIIRPRTPYYDWANGFDDGGPKMDPADPEMSCTAFLMPECDGSADARQYVLDHYAAIFREMLASWMLNSDTWPVIDMKTFRRWFDFEIHEPVFDLTDDDIIAEDE
jgi:hypothetical protein